MDYNMKMLVTLALLSGSVTSVLLYLRERIPTTGHVIYRAKKRREKLSLWFRRGMLVTATLVILAALYGTWL